MGDFVNFKGYRALRYAPTLNFDRNWCGGILLIMIYSLNGILTAKKENFVVVKAGPISYRIFVSGGVLERLPAVGAEAEFFTYFNVREDSQELFGFLSEKELVLFEALIGVSGVGPRTALNIMGIADINQLIAAINEGRSDLLGRASGVGKKTAERVALELKGRLAFDDGSESIGKMEADVDLEETLVNLGLSRGQAKAAIAAIDPNITEFNERLKAALKRNSK